jgi:hypothetical protein
MFGVLGSVFGVLGSVFGVPLFGVRAFGVPVFLVRPLADNLARLATDGRDF